MNLSRPFILRPVATTLLMLALLLSGLFAYRLLPVAALPQVDYPTIQVLTFYPGASPEVMTSSITAPLERQFGQMPGLRQMSSTSSGGASVVTLQFNLELPLDVAEQQVQAAINAGSNFLPSDLPAPPVYNKVNPADAPVLTLGITSATLPLTQVQNLVDTRVATKISQVPGVGLVVALIVITLIGALAANLVGRTVLHYWENFLGRMPVVRSVYSAVKQIFQTAFAKPGSNFQQVGLIEFPRRGAHVIVFVARELDSREIGLAPGQAMYSLFMPTTPNPTSGFLFFLNQEEVTILDLTVEEAAKLVISAGLVSPDRLRGFENVPILDEQLTATLTRQAKKQPENEPAKPRKTTRKPASRRQGA